MVKVDISVYSLCMLCSYDARCTFSVCCGQTKCHKLCKCVKMNSARKHVHMGSVCRGLLIVRSDGLILAH